MTLPHRPNENEVERWQQRHQLRESLAALDLQPSPSQLSQLHAFTTLLLRWNRTYNLVGAKDESVFVGEHLIDCLAIVPTLSTALNPSRSVLIDMGSGGGLPGLVVAIMMPTLAVHMVEPVAKKAAFLRQASSVCALVNTSVAECRMTQIAASLATLAARLPNREHRHFSSRAFAAMRRLTDEAMPFALPGSRLFAMKSSRLTEELDGFNTLAVTTHSLVVPGLRAPRFLAEIALDRPWQASACADQP